MKWPSYDQKLWKSVTNPRLAIQWCAYSRYAIFISSATPPLIIGSDILKEAILISEKNSEKAGVRNQIQFQHSAFQDLFPRIKSFLPIENGTQKKGFIISNLPFGKRTDEKDIRGLYQAMGKVWMLANLILHWSRWDRFRVGQCSLWFPPTMKIYYLTWEWHSMKMKLEQSTMEAWL